MPEVCPLLLAALVLVSVAAPSSAAPVTMITGGSNSVTGGDLSAFTFPSPDALVIETDFATIAFSGEEDPSEVGSLDSLRWNEDLGAALDASLDAFTPMDLGDGSAQSAGNIPLCPDRQGPDRECDSMLLLGGGLFTLAAVTRHRFHKERTPRFSSSRLMDPRREPVAHRR